MSLELSILRGWRQHLQFVDSALTRVEEWLALWGIDYRQYEEACACGSCKICVPPPQGPFGNPYEPSTHPTYCLNAMPMEIITMIGEACVQKFNGVAIQQCMCWSTEGRDNKGIEDVLGAGPSSSNTPANYSEDGSVAEANEVFSDAFETIDKLEANEVSVGAVEVNGDSEADEVSLSTFEQPDDYDAGEWSYEDPVLFGATDDSGGDDGWGTREDVHPWEVNPSVSSWPNRDDREDWDDSHSAWGAHREVQYVHSRRAPGHSTELWHGGIGPLRTFTQLNRKIRSETESMIGVQITATPFLGQCHTTSSHHLHCDLEDNIRRIKHDISDFKKVTEFTVDVRTMQPSDLGHNELRMIHDLFDLLQAMPNLRKLHFNLGYAALINPSIKEVFYAYFDRHDRWLRTVEEVSLGQFDTYVLRACPNVRKIASIGYFTNTQEPELDITMVWLAPWGRYTKYRNHDHAHPLQDLLVELSRGPKLESLDLETTWTASLLQSIVEVQPGLVRLGMMGSKPARGVRAHGCLRFGAVSVTLDRHHEPTSVSEGIRVSHNPSTTTI